MCNGIYTAEDIENKLKEKISSIKELDIQSYNFQDIEGSFDVVSSMFCLDVASKTLQELSHNLENIYITLRKGGGTILVFALNCEFYRVGDRKYSSLSLSQKKVESIVKNLKLREISTDLYNVDPQDGYGSVMMLSCIR